MSAKHVQLNVFNVYQNKFAQNALVHFTFKMVYAN